jgi:hypothetical protein
METYYFHIRDALGVVEDTEGVELAGIEALLTEVIRSANELSREGAGHNGKRFEIADASGRTVLVTPVQESLASWDMMARLCDAQLPVH